MWVVSSALVLVFTCLIYRSVQHTNHASTSTTTTHSTPTSYEYLMADFTRCQIAHNACTEVIEVIPIQNAFDRTGDRSKTIWVGATPNGRIMTLSCEILIKEARHINRKVQCVYKFGRSIDISSNESPDVIIWVQGRATSPDIRAMIRETFGNAKLWPEGIKVLTLFFVGKQEGYQKLLEYESKMYRDIVQNNYTEAYQNQICKMVSAINYIADYCSDAKLILRIDDDVVFHPTLMLEQLLTIFANNQTTLTVPELTNSKLSRGTIACRLISGFSVWRKKDHPHHFNVVADNILVGVNLFPPFCAGFFVAMSGDVPKLLKPTMVNNEPFWMDDRYMGVLQKAASIHNIDITNLLDFGYVGPITKESLDQFLSKTTIARHLDGRFRLRITQLFEYLRLNHNGLRAHFEEIPISEKLKSKL